MTPTEVGTCEWLVGEIHQVGLLDPAALDPVVSEFIRDNPYADATALAEYLVRLGLLSSFQANRLLEGEGRGLVLGPYALADAIGTGSLGTVYLAWGRADRQAYAVKVLPQRSLWNARQARRKLQTLPTETHPAVVPFVDVGTSASRHYLVWPYVEGDTLETVVRRDGLLSPARAAIIGVHVAQAMQYFERHRICHGLIKPSNVIIGPDGQAKLLDFGLGLMLADGEDESMVDTLAESNSACNMFDCASPESIIDPAKKTVRGDQYSLGCTLYFGLTGRYPFPDGTIFDKMSAHQSQQPTPVSELNPTVPAALQLVLERLMQKSPEARYNQIAELISALMPLARMSAIYAPPPRSLTPPPFLGRGSSDSWSRPNPSLLSAVTPRDDLPPAADSTPPPPRPARSSSDRIPAAPPAASYQPAPAAPLADAPPPPQLPLWRRLVQKLAFWRPTADPVSCTLLTPLSVMPGETVTLQIVAHHVERTGLARTLDDWRGTAHLPEPVVRGESIGLHLALEGLKIEKPLAYIEWRGMSAAVLLKAVVPADWRPGHPVQGTLTIGRNHQPVARLEFCLPVAGAEVATGS